ncbi:MAG: isochorismatase family protein [Anaerolineales bacterium]
MKTRFFSPENLSDEALQLADKLPGFQNKRFPTFKPEQSALLILDMQSYFLDPASHAFIPSMEAIVPGIKKLALLYYQNNLPVLFTQHLNTPQDAGSMATWWRELISIENPLSAIISEFDFSRRYVLRKNQYDAFYQTNLEEILRIKGVTQVVISGVMTHLCCETTARSAFMRGFDVYFLIDGTATYNEEHQLATLLNLSHGFAQPVLTAEITRVLEEISEK